MARYSVKHGDFDSTVEQPLARTDDAAVEARPTGT
jgi:hypothetical protein